MPVDPHMLDEFSTQAAREVARVWDEQFQKPLPDNDLERLTAAIHFALNGKMFSDAN